MPRIIPARVRFKTVHTVRWESAGFDRVRHTFREYGHVARRPSSGSSDVVVECGDCGRRAAYRIHDREWTRKRRWRFVGKSAIGLAVCLALVVLAFSGLPIWLAAIVIVFGGVGTLVTFVLVTVGSFDELGVVDVTEEVLGVPPRRPGDGGKAGKGCLTAVEPVKP